MITVIGAVILVGALIVASPKVSLNRLLESP